MVTHSILVPYRNRIKQLLTFLESIDLPPDWELIITDLGSADDSKALIAQHQDRLTIRHLWVDYKGIFNRSKALNHALAHSEAEWVTTVDIDCIFSRKFFHGVAAKLSEADAAEYLTDSQAPKKLSYTVYRIPYPLVRHLVFDLPKDWYAKFLSQIIDHPERYPYPYRNTYENRLTGNSHFTIRKADILSVGAWDERYEGHGLEDIELNMRLWNKYGDTSMYLCPIFQVSHRYEADWTDPDAMAMNQFLFAQAKEDGFPPIELPKDFSTFKKESALSGGID